MDYQMQVLITGFLVALVFLAFYFHFTGRIKLLSSQLAQEKQMSLILKSELDQERNLVSEEKEKVKQYIQENTIFKTELKHLRDKYENLVSDNEQQVQKFENIANRILKSQSESIADYQTKGMQDILNPLKERIQRFEDKIEKTNVDSVQRHQSLKEQIKYLSERSEKVAHDANNLAKALKGNYKQQGNWGELILESILDKSGLQKDREYFLQVSERSDSGKLYKPDVVIELPDGKKLIIDSKVSLVAFDKLVNAETEDEAAVHKSAHLLALRNHIDGLSVKNYHDLYHIESPDFVMMFIPMDTAFIAALEVDNNLYNYAFERNIVIVTSSTLLATLKTVETMWRNDKQNKYALEISVEAGKMYDKFVSFVQDMNKLGAQIQTTQNTYNDSMKKLANGSGNLVKRAEHVRSLGAKANKKLDANKLLN